MILLTVTVVGSMVFALAIGTVAAICLNVVVFVVDNEIIFINTVAVGDVVILNCWTEMAWCTYYSRRRRWHTRFCRRRCRAVQTVVVVDVGIGTTLVTCEPALSLVIVVICDTASVVISEYLCWVVFHFDAYKKWQFIDLLLSQHMVYWHCLQRWKQL